MYEQKAFCPAPKPLFDINMPVKIASGEGHFACTTANGEVFTWGLNEYGQVSSDGVFSPCI